MPNVAESMTLIREALHTERPRIQPEWITLDLRDHLRGLFGPRFQEARREVEARGCKRHRGGSCGCYGGLDAYAEYARWKGRMLGFQRPLASMYRWREDYPALGWLFMIHELRAEYGDLKNWPEHDYGSAEESRVVYWRSHSEAQAQALKEVLSELGSPLKGPLPK